MFYILVAFVVSFVATAVCMPVLLKQCRKRGFYDVPDERKVHRNNTPRLGGILFMPSMLLGVSLSIVGLVLSGHGEMFSAIGFTAMMIVIGMFMIYIIGLLDDIFGMRASVKFIIQIAVSLFLPFCGLYIHNLHGFCGIYELPLWAGYALTIFVSLLIVNAVNLIDGIDGLASSLSILATLAFGGLYLARGMYVYALYSYALTGAVCAFWLFNMFGKSEKGTKTFMGDTGSLTLGYALAFLAIRYVMEDRSIIETNPGNVLIVPFTLLLVPCFDLVRVAIMRVARGKSIFHPDKTHIHHKCLRAGFSMRGSLAMIVSFQLFFCLANWLITLIGGRINSIVVFDVVVFVLFNQWLNYGIVKNKNPHL